MWVRLVAFKMSVILNYNETHSNLILQCSQRLPSATSKGIFPSGNLPNVQFPKRELPKSVLAAATPPLS